MFVALLAELLAFVTANVKGLAQKTSIMRKKTLEKVQQDLMVDELYPYLPPNYASLVQHFLPNMDAMRLYNVVRKRGTEPDSEAYRALLMVRRSSPVGRQPRKKYAPRTNRALAV